MSKTAIEQLREWVENDLKLEGYEHDIILNQVFNMLSVEKQQIIDAYTEGAVQGIPASGKPSSYAIKYYNDTFKK